MKSVVLCRKSYSAQISNLKQNHAHNTKLESERSHRAHTLSRHIDRKHRVETSKLTHRHRGDTSNGHIEPTYRAETPCGDMKQIPAPWGQGGGFTATAGRGGNHGATNAALCAGSRRACVRARPGPSCRPRVRVRACVRCVCVCV